VANYDAPADRSGAKVLEMWGMDSISVAEIAVTLSRQQSVNDQTRGVRFNIPALIPGGAGTVGSHNMLPGSRRSRSTSRTTSPSPSLRRRTTRLP
jgi:hypothetical protein